MKKNLSLIRIVFIVLLVVFVISMLWHGWKYLNLPNNAEVAANVPLVTTVDDISFQPNVEAHAWTINSNNGDTIVFAPHYCTDVYLNRSADSQNGSWLSISNGICLFAGAILFIIALVNIYSFFNALTKGTFFTQENTMRLKKAGILFALLPFLEYLATYLSFLQNEKLMQPFHFKVLNNSIFDFGTFMTGLLLLAISYAFKKGIELQQEQDLTI